ncbi:MAG: hypothetical protein H7246_09360, partial [Phycisphaerae bacterium]|nr:hypothetical protein [Saprospiraceae bacterium]
MIKSIAFEGYKAFKTGDIKLKPITLLLGANSVGKSSILQLLLILQQTAVVDKEYNSPIKLYGGGINIGEIENLFKNKNLKSPIIISTEIESIDLFSFIKEIMPATFIHEMYQNIIIPFQLFDKLEKHNSKINLNIFDAITPKDNFDTQRKNLIESIQNLPKNLLRLNRHKNKKISNYFNEASEFNIYENREEFLFVTDFIFQLSSQIISKKFKYTFHIVYNSEKKSLTKKKIIISNDENIIIDLTFNLNGKLEKVEFPFLKTRFLFDYSKVIENIIKGDQSIFSI